MALQKPVKYYVTPTTGQTVTIPTFDGQRMVVMIDPSGTLATLTVTLPACDDGQVVTLSSSQIVTALTLNGGTIIGAITSLVLGGYAEYAYSATASKWFKLS